MQKILVFSYFFPPCNQVAAERTAAWALYLNEFGYYPIIVTRNWNPGQIGLTEKIIQNELKHETHEHYEVYRLPYAYSLRDRMVNYPTLRLFQRVLTLSEMVLSNFFLRTLPYSNFYTQGQTILKKNPDIKAILATGRPFQTFHIASALKDEFNIPFIADYRDEWNTYQMRVPKNILQKFLFELEKKSEWRWTRNADAYFSVSDYWVQSIGKFIQKKGYTVMNGFIPNSKIKVAPTKNNGDPLTIGYVGTLYAEQPIEKSLNLLKPFLKNHSTLIRLVFIGIEIIPEQKNRIQCLLTGFDSSFEIYPRMGKEELSRLMDTIDIMLITGFNGIKGWYPVKIFDCFNYQKPMLLYPSDKDVIADFIRETESGFIPENDHEFISLIESWVEIKSSNPSISAKFNQEAGEKYTRREQVRKMARHLDEILFKK